MINNRDFTRQEFETAANTVERRSKFYYHLFFYLEASAFLVFINLLDGGYFWSAWPVAGWGIGLIFHGAATFGFINFQNWKDRMVQKELGKIRREQNEFNSKLNN